MTALPAVATRAFATRAGTIVVSCVLAAALVVGALSLISSRTPGLLLLLVGALVALVVLLVVPVHVLPVFALVIITAIPDRLTDFTTSPLITPATVVLAVWIVRRLLLRVILDPAGPSLADQPGLTGLRRVTVLLGVIMVPLVVVAPVQQFAVSWILTYVVAIIAILQIGPIDREASSLRTALPWVGTVAAVYALLQTVWEDNVIYTPLYEALGKVDVQHWAVYRADGSLGHPLLAGLFFAIVLTFCLGRWFETGQRRFVIPALINAAGIVCTVSRGSYIAAAVGVVALLVAAMLTGRLRTPRLTAILAGLVAAGYLALNTDSFVQRTLSVEGLASLNSRDALPQITLATAAPTTGSAVVRPTRCPSPHRSTTRACRSRTPTCNWSSASGCRARSRSWPSWSSRPSSPTARATWRRSAGWSRTRWPSPGSRPSTPGAICWSCSAS